MRIYLTDMGKAEVDQLTAIKDEFADALFNVLTQEEKAQMMTVIAKLYHNMEIIPHEIS